MIDKSDADRLRSLLCPVVENEKCVRGSRVSGSLVDQRGEWGALRLINLTDAATPRMLAHVHSPTARVFPPPDLGVYAPNRPIIDGPLAYVPWNSDGLRVFQLKADGMREVAAFVPPDMPDPSRQLPAKAYVVGLALLRNKKGTTTHVVVSDLNFGVYVLAIRR